MVGILFITHIKRQRMVSTYCRYTLHIHNSTSHTSHTRSVTTTTSFIIIFLYLEYVGIVIFHNSSGLMALDLSYGHSPFPFSDRPALPHIDAFQDNEKLRVAGRNHLQLSPVSKNHEQFPEDEDQLFGHFTVKEIRHVHRFIKSFGGDNDYGITLDELESAFRKVRRAHKNKDEEAYARRLMNTFEFLLKIKALSPKMWFQEVDTSQANKGDGKLTWLEFEAGMNKLCLDLGAASFSKHDLNVILKYMDPNGDGDLSYQEVSRGFRRIHLPADCQKVLEDSGPILPYLQDFMGDRQIRVRDLFNFFDIRNKKIITFDVLCDGIERVAVCMPPPSPTSHDPSCSTVPRSATAVFERSNDIGESKVSFEKCKTLPPLKDKPKSTSRKCAPLNGTDILLSPVSTKCRTERDYRRQVQRHFRMYDDWLKQFDRKLQNGLVLMTKM